MSTDALKNLPRTRAVVDTNIVFSAVTHRGAPYRIVEAGQAGEFLWVVSNDILIEYVEVLAEHGLMPLANPLLSWIKQNAFNVQVPSFLPDTFTDIVHPSDRVVFSAAYVAGAYFVTGNKRHFPWASYRGVKILSPVDFYDIL